MKRFTELVCLILIASMILAVPGYAAMDASHFFISHSCYLVEVSDSTFQAWFDVTAVDVMDTLGASEIKIQRSTDKVNWETVQTNYNIFGYGTGFHSGYVTYSSRESGFYYRAKVTFYAENDTGVGEYTDATSYI